MTTQSLSFAGDPVKIEFSATEISANFTKGDILKLVVSPASEWLKLLEPTTGDVPYPSKFVWIDVTDPYGNVSAYEIAFAKPLGASVLAFYKVSIRPNSTTSGFGGQDIIGLSQTEKALVGRVMYTGQYLARVVAVLPGGGGPPDSLEFYKGNNVIVYPYRDYFYLAIIMSLSGIALSVWSLKVTKRRKIRRKKAGKRAA